MFARWGRWVFRNRALVLGLSAVLFATSVLVALRGARLATAEIAGTESARAREMLERDTGRRLGSSFTAVFHSARWTVADNPGYCAAVEHALEPLRHDHRVAGVRSPCDPAAALSSELFIGADGHWTVATVDLAEDFQIGTRDYPAFREGVRARSAPLESTFTGDLALMSDLDAQLQRDLHSAEFFSAPAAAIFLLLAFGTVVASLVPLGVGALAVLGGVAGVFMLSHSMTVARYAINIVTLVGLGVAIDYSLFIVKRFQEELELGSNVEDAVAHAVDTAGHAVAFSGLAVATGLAGLLFFNGSYLASIGIAGAIVVALAVLYSLTFLPALLGVMGHGIQWGRIRRPRPVPASGGAWHRLALQVMAHPIRVLVPTLIVLLLIGAPFLRIQLSGSGIYALPPMAEARQGHELLRQHFPARLQDPIVVVAHFPHNAALSPAHMDALYDLSRSIATYPGVERLMSPVDLDPRISRQNYEQIASASPSALPPMITVALQATIGPHTAVLAVIPRRDATAAQQAALVERIRTIHHVADGELIVGGRAANNVDSRHFIRQRTPIAIGFVMISMLVVLFFLMRSVVLPIKAVLMNLLSIAGSFGAMVWIFQEGHLHTVLGFTPAPIDPALPIVLFCAVFGLSMDYEVFLLTRMREEYLRTGDNTHSVAEGLERSGRLITSAAAIMVAVFTAFALARVVLIQAVGLGMAIAILLDATLVRVLIVPATMRLFGDLNWWVPRPLAKWARSDAPRH